MAWSNHSVITEFVLTGLSDDPLIQALLFALFLGIYVLTMTGNLTMLLVITADSHLHTPMYFFLSNLSFLDLCFSSVTVPKLLKDLLSAKKTISVEGCLAQVFFVFITAGTEAFLLSVMAYDRYAAVCHPLLYGQMMSNELCLKLVLLSWGLASLSSVVIVLLAVNLDFCEAYTIHHYTLQRSHAHAKSPHLQPEEPGGEGRCEKDIREVPAILGVTAKARNGRMIQCGQAFFRPLT